MICSAVCLVRFMVESPAQSGRLRTLIHPGTDFRGPRHQDRRPMKRINQLIQACLRDAFVGIGKPEPHL